MLALAVVSNWVYAESSPASAAPAEKEVNVENEVSEEEEASVKNEEKRTGVRKPIGDANKFWANIEWTDMSPEEQKLWEKLSNGASWDKLSNEARTAAKALGFNKKAWNSVPAGSTK